MKLTAHSLLLLGALGLALTAIAGPTSASRPQSRAADDSPASAVASVGPTQSDEINKANWQQHPKIKAVRAVVQTVKTSLGNKTVKVRTRKFEYCEPYEDASRTLGVDAQGRVRYYEKQAGSDDSALKWEHYYDESGRLRFVFITGGAANGSRLEHRIYFDEDGKRLWEEHKYTKGPGYTFPETWPDEELQRSDVAAAFNAKSPCPEITSKKAKGKRQK